MSSVDYKFFAIAIGLFLSPIAQANDWLDTYYQYRIPVDVTVDHAGWNVVSIDEKAITDAINSIEELKYSPRGSEWFAYNYCIAVEVDEQGDLVNSDLDSGFYLIEEGPNLIQRATDSKEDTISIEVDSGTKYLLCYTASDAQELPNGGLSRHPLMHAYELIHPHGSSLRKTNYISYIPPMLPRKLQEHQRLFIPESDSVSVITGGRFVSGIQKMSLRKAQIVFAANFKRAGLVRLMFYYQPMCAHYLMVPEKRLPRIPQSTASVITVKKTQKYNGDTRYGLKNDDTLGIWFAETTVKLTPNTPMPAEQRKGISISAASNESQSFQVVLRPKSGINFKSIEITDLKSYTHTITTSDVDIRQLDYVQINRMSDTTPASRLGLMGDPLIPVKPRGLDGNVGNVAFWITLEVPPHTPAGTYDGKVLVKLANRTVEIPLSLYVYDFELPEFSPLHTVIGGAFFTSSMDDSDDRASRPGSRGLIGYHGIKPEDHADVRALIHDYYTLMAKNKFYPRSVYHGENITLSWSPPPDGYNVDTPGNYFRLYDWDFDAFNERLAFFIDKCKVNTFTILHTDPMLCNRFGIPGRIQRSRSTSVAYGIEPGDPSVDHEISEAQYEHLLLDYFRTIAQNLEKHGWLDHAFITIDESMHQSRYLKFLRVLKSDPLVAKLKVGACVQGYEPLYYKEHPGNREFAFKGLLDFYMPQMDEKYNRWEKYLFPDHNITPKRDKLWNYAVSTSRLEIDVPGVNNRMIGFDLFNRGASGFYVWETIYWTTTQQGRGNPWKDPYTVWGNGAVSYFYPPTREGVPQEPDFTVTPSSRVFTFRESVDDYEYAWLLENLISRCKENNIPVAEAQETIDQIERFFHDSVNWSQNDAWYLKLRDRMARAIVQLKELLAREQT